MTISERGWTEIKVSTSMIIVATMAVSLRFLARRLRKVSLGLDDWTAFTALMLLFAMYLELLLWAIIGGFGKHPADLNKPELERFLKTFLSFQLTYMLTRPTVKLSIVFFYRRVFAIKPFRSVVNSAILFTVVWGLAAFLASVLQCRPLSGFWDPSIHARCLDRNKLVLGNGIINVVIDLVILGLPMPIIWNLKRPLKDKIAITGLFILGGFACVASIVRVVTLIYVDNHDVPYTIYQLITWTWVEPCLEVVCGCLPIIRGMFRHSLSSSQNSTLGSTFKKLFKNQNSPSEASATVTEADRSVFLSLKDQNSPLGLQFPREAGFAPQIVQA